MAKSSCVPPCLKSSIQTAGIFYARSGKLPLFEHCLRVIDTATSVGIVEPKVIEDPKEKEDRRWANSTIAENILYHVVKAPRVNGNGIRLPPPLCDDRVVEQVEIFNSLTELERNGSDLSSYGTLLRSYKSPPLALLAKIADYAVTHQTEEHLEGLIDPSGESIFRLYPSRARASEMLLMDAEIGEAVYAKIAELFGYPILAGKIYKHVFSVNHPEIFSFIQESSRRPETRQRILLTQLIAKELENIISSRLGELGIAATITVRDEKHDGKKMRKLLRLVGEDYERSGEKCCKSLKCFVRQNLGEFEFDRFSDMVALRVVLHGKPGVSVDSLITPEKRAFLRAGPEKISGKENVGSLLSDLDIPLLAQVANIIEDSIKELAFRFSDLVGELDFKQEFHNKSNAYRALHFDVRRSDSSKSNGHCRIFPFEIQLKTEEWHNIAEHGKAAHYLYLGGDPALMGILSERYDEILALLGGNGRHAA